jgi:hypothetical protein
MTPENVIPKRHPLTLVRGYMLSQPLLLTVFLFVWLFIIYSELPLPVAPGISLPCMYLLFMIPFVWPVLMKSVRMSHIYLVVGLLLIGALSIITKWDLTLLGNSVFKWLQFAFSAIVCVVSAAVFMHAGKDVAGRLLGFFLIFIVVGCLFERLGLIRPLTEAFRVVYSETKGGGEIDADRELELAGFARPYFFTAEPSLVGLGYFSIACCFSFLNRRLLYDILLLIGVVLMLSLLGSPTVLLTIFPVGIFMLVKYRISGRKILAILLLIIIPTVILLRFPPVFEAAERVITRVATETMVENSSMYGRVYVPYFITLPKVLPVYPLFGVGLGNFGYVNLLFGYNADYYELDSLFIHGSNGFVTMIVYLGIAGTLLVYLLIRWFHKSLSIPYWWMTVFFMVVSGQITGSVSTPRFWAFTGIAIACLQVGSKRIEKHDAN